VDDECICEVKNNTTFMHACMCVFICSERDEFERALSDLQKQHSLLDNNHQAVTAEREQLAAEVFGLCLLVKYLTWGTGIRGLMRGMATIPQGNRELLVVRDKV